MLLTSPVLPKLGSPCWWLHVTCKQGICVSQTPLCQGKDQGILSSLIKPLSFSFLPLKLLYKQNLYLTLNRGAARGGAARGTRGAARGGPPTRGAPAGRGAPPARPAPPVPAPPPPPQRETYDEYAAPVRIFVFGSINSLLDWDCAILKRWLCG